MFQMEKHNRLNRQRKLNCGRHMSLIPESQLREISTTIECCCGKEGQSDGS